MDHRTRARTRLLNAAMILLGLVSAATVAWPTWFETVSGSDPDGGDGSFERSVVRVLALSVLVAVATVVRAGSDRRVAAARAEGLRAHG